MEQKFSPDFTGISLEFSLKIVSVKTIHEGNVHRILENVAEMLPRYIFFSDLVSEENF